MLAIYLSALRPHITDWILQTRLFEPCAPQQAGITLSAGRAVGGRLIAGHRQPVVDAKFQPLLDLSALVK
jgi:hypothetical protein